MMQLIETHKNMEGKRSLFFTTDLMPPSINAAWKHCVRFGRAVTYKSKKAKEFQLKFKRCVPADFKIITGEVSVEININHKTKRKQDIDNRIKMLLDSMNKTVLLDDSQIMELNIKQKMGIGTNLVSMVVIEK